MRICKYLSCVLIYIPSDKCLRVVWQGGIPLLNVTFKGEKYNINKL
jgi:hypothetical protein